MSINIAIDGPSGAGKSTISGLLASELAYVHLDTGSMYRAVAYKALKEGISVDDEASLVPMIKRMELKIETDGTIYCDGEDVSKKIRENNISMAASDVSRHAGVRKEMVAMQQAIAANKGYILDGRDIGTVVLKDAELKIYLTASAETRAQRRVKQNKEKGIDADYDKILADIIARDYQDMHRDNSPLTQAEDAILIDSSYLSIDEVVNQILLLAKERS